MSPAPDRRGLARFPLAAQALEPRLFEPVADPVERQDRLDLQRVVDEDEAHPIDRVIGLGCGIGCGRIARQQQRVEGQQDPVAVPASVGLRQAAHPGARPVGRPEVEAIAAAALAFPDPQVGNGQPLSLEDLEGLGRSERVALFRRGCWTRRRAKGFEIVRVAVVIVAQRVENDTLALALCIAGHQRALFRPEAAPDPRHPGFVEPEIEELDSCVGNEAGHGAKRE